MGWGGWWMGGKDILSLTNRLFLSRTILCHHIICHHLSRCHLPLVPVTAPPNAATGPPKVVTPTADPAAHIPVDHDAEARPAVRIPSPLTELCIG